MKIEWAIYKHAGYYYPQVRHEGTNKWYNIEGETTSKEAAMFLIEKYIDRLKKPQLIEKGYVEI